MQLVLCLPRIVICITFECRIYKYIDIYAYATYLLCGAGMTHDDAIEKAAKAEDDAKTDHAMLHHSLAAVAPAGSPAPTAAADPIHADASGVSLGPHSV